jgi:hypothetical protein
MSTTVVVGSMVSMWGLTTTPAGRRKAMGLRTGR